jgi:hypothetical protein
VTLDPQILQQPGLHSGKITAVLEATGETAFEVPVTVVSPVLMNDANQHRFAVDTSIRVGQSLRYFIDVPAGTTAVQLAINSDGPIVWGQWLNNEGRVISHLQDPQTTNPQPPLFAQANLSQPGVYELDLVAPAYNARPAKVHAEVHLFSLSTVMGPAETTKTNFQVQLTNNDEPLQLVPRLDFTSLQRKQVLSMGSAATVLPEALSASDLQNFAKLRWEVVTAKALYDQMTDYPYWVTDEKNNVLTSGGAELDTLVELTGFDKLTPGNIFFGIQGAFTQAAPTTWAVQLTEDRVFLNPKNLSIGSRFLIEDGQSVYLPVDVSQMAGSGGLTPCATLSLTAVGGNLVQTIPICP